MPLFGSHSIELRTFIVELSNSVNSREKKKERKRDRKTERDRERRKREIERERQFESLREISGERLQVRHIEIRFFDYILPENNPGKLSKQNKLISPGSIPRLRHTCMHIYYELIYIMHVQYTGDYHFYIYLEYPVSCSEKTHTVSVRIVFNINFFFNQQAELKQFTAF